MSELPSLIPEDAMNELRMPYMDDYNRLAFHDLSENIAHTSADFNADWEEEYLITAEAKDRQLRHELVTRRYEETAEARRVRMEDRENQRRWLEREAYTNSLIQSALMTCMEDAYQETEPYTEPTNVYQEPKHKPNPNYKPHYTKPWTASDLAAVGVSSTKQSTAQKVYQECYAKQDRAWHASIKSQIKWKK